MELPPIVGLKFALNLGVGFFNVDVEVRFKLIGLKPFLLFSFCSMMRSLADFTSGLTAACFWFSVDKFSTMHKHEMN